jgi:gamma-glutamylcysteine synthetase
MDAQELRPIVSGLFAGTATRTARVGIEQELLVADAAGRTVPVPRLRALLAGCPLAAYVAYEPGGQLELNLPPSDSPASAEVQLRVSLRDVRDHLERAGIRITADPVDPRPEREVPLRVRSPRYAAMQRHFDTIGPAGRRMMRRTASTQLCLDWWPGRAGAEQWRALHLVAPFLAARYARSTGPESRLATWLAVDPARTAFDGRLLAGDDPVSAYVDLALGATRFVDGGPADHLTTLFPPVRPRGRYLEVRFLDAQPTSAVGEIAATLGGILYDADRRHRVLRRLEPLAGRLDELWAAAAAGDLADHGPSEAAA